ncbi:MAG: hypothetical protein JWM86_1393, partial [Thermoleophilia bacterium]|nr:hypothetical protein [Thermoleophilia bacterium]
EQHGTTGTDAAPSQEELENANDDDLEAARAAGGPSNGDRPSQAVLEEVGYPESEGGELDDLGPVPGLTNVHETYNLPKGTKLDAAFLKDKVVIYDFWTYSCINCIRTLPYLRTWHERYAEDGLVIVGVHAPEFAFEKDEGNVRDAIADLGVTWPVATDPELETWSAFHNHYWPAKYIADRDGNLRYVHFGEGGYEDTEAVIRELLDKEPSAQALPTPVEVAAATPETYLGGERLNGEQYRGIVQGTSERAVFDKPATFGISHPESPLAPDQFAFTGRWTIEGERAVAMGADSGLQIHYRARAVYLVLDAGAAGSATVTVHDSATDGGGTRRVRVSAEKLYTLRDGETPADGLLRLEVPKGVSAYAFTFG